MGREEQEAERFAEVTRRLRAANVEVGRTRGTFDPVIEAIPTLGTLAVLAVGASQVARRRARAGRRRAGRLPHLGAGLPGPGAGLGARRAAPHASSAGTASTAVLRGPGRAGVRLAARCQRRGAAHARLDDVDYSYEVVDEHGRAVRRHQAIHGVTLDVPAGSTVALVGPTGSGKTTLTNLSLRLVDPAPRRGDRSTGVDLREVVARRRRRRSPPSCPSRPSCSTTRSAATSPSARDHTDEEVWTALRVAQADGFVAALPAGLDTRVGERGTSLSGRPAAAGRPGPGGDPAARSCSCSTTRRAPSTPRSSRRSSPALRETSSGTTVLVVAYRMSTITLADEIVYIEGGRVVDHGTHAELRAAVRRLPAARHGLRPRGRRAGRARSPTRRGSDA